MAGAIADVEELQVSYLFDKGPFCEICKTPVREGLRFCPGLSPCWRAALKEGLTVNKPIDRRDCLPCSGVGQPRELCAIWANGKTCEIHGNSVGVAPVHLKLRAITPADGPKPDSVNHPSYYNTGKYEVIDVIEDWQLGFCLGNAVKYIARAGKKDPKKTVEDLLKAAWYLDREIKRIKGE